MCAVALLRIEQVGSAGGTDDGKNLAVQCVDQGGQQFSLLVPVGLEVDFLSKFMAASSLCAERRGDRVTAFDPETIDIAASPDGRLAVRLAFQSGLEMRLLLKDEQLAQLRQAFDALDDRRKAGGPGRYS